MALRIAALVIGLTFVAIACESSESARNAVYSGPHTTTCSDGPPRDASIPPGPPSSQENLPACVPRCGGDLKHPGLNGPIHSIAALPSGRCPADGEQCQMTAAFTVNECPGEEARGCDVSYFECRCEAADWRCYAVAPGGGVCVCAGDAGPGDAESGHDASDAPDNDDADE